MEMDTEYEPLKPKPRPKKIKFSKLNWPVYAQIVSVIIGLACAIISMEAIIHDSEWNKKLNTSLAEVLINETPKGKNGSQFTKKEIVDLLSRDSPMKKIFCLLVSFCTVLALVHIFIYQIYKREPYRYKFTIFLNSFLAIIFGISSILLLITTLNNDSNYGEIFHLLRERNVPANTTGVTLYIFRYCQANAGTRDEDQIPDVPEQFKDTLAKESLCQKFYNKVASILLACLNLLFFAIVALTVKSARQQIKKALNMARDLDVEPWMWVHPNGSREFLMKYIYEQEKAKFILKEIDEEPRAPPKPKLVVRPDKSTTSSEVPKVEKTDAAPVLKMNDVD